MKTVVSNSTFDRGSLSPTSIKPFDECANGGATRTRWDTEARGFRAHWGLIGLRNSQRGCPTSPAARLRRDSLRQQELASRRVEARRQASEGWLLGLDSN